MNGCLKIPLCGRFFFGLFGRFIPLPAYICPMGERLKHGAETQQGQPDALQFAVNDVYTSA